VTPYLLVSQGLLVLSPSTKAVRCSFSAGGALAKAKRSLLRTLRHDTSRRFCMQKGAGNRVLREVWATSKLCRTGH